jgi:elongation factor G
LVKWQAWIHDTPEGEDARVVDLPRSADFEREQNVFSAEHPLVPELLTARTALLDTLSMHSEELMDTLLSLTQDAPGYLEVSPEPIISALRAATLQGQVLPVLCGSALNHIGTETVLDYAGYLLASPNDVSLVPRDDGFVQMLAWKVSWDSKRGWMTFVRVYSGKCLRFIIHITAND